MTDLASVLTRLASRTPGHQLETFNGVTYFHALTRSDRSGWTYEVHDFARGEEVALESPVADERRFVMADRSFFQYQFPFHEPPIADVSSLERQLLAGVYCSANHGALNPR